MAVAYEYLVREFYSNAQIVENRIFETFVMGRVYQVIVATIFNMIKPVRRELDARFSFNQTLEMIDIGVELTSILIMFGVGMQSLLSKGI